MNDPHKATKDDTLARSMLKEHKEEWNFGDMTGIRILIPDRVPGNSSVKA